jgi:hypothetical protein
MCSYRVRHGQRIGLVWVVVEGLLDDCCCKHFGLQRDGLLQARVRSCSCGINEGVGNDVYLVVVVALVRTAVEVVRRIGRVEGSVDIHRTAVEEPVGSRHTVGEGGCHSRTAAGAMEEPGLVEGSHSLVVVEVDTAAEAAGIHTHSEEAVARSLLPDRRDIVGRGSRTCFHKSEEVWVGERMEVGRRKLRFGGRARGRRIGDWRVRRLFVGGGKRMELESCRLS